MKKFVCVFLVFVLFFGFGLPVSAGELTESEPEWHEATVIELPHSDGLSLLLGVVKNVFTSYRYPNGDFITQIYVLRYSELIFSRDVELIGLPFTGGYLPPRQVRAGEMVSFDRYLSLTYWHQGGNFEHGIAFVLVCEFSYWEIQSESPREYFYWADGVTRLPVFPQHAIEAAAYHAELERRGVRSFVDQRGMTIGRLSLLSENAPRPPIVPNVTKQLPGSDYTTVIFTNAYDIYAVIRHSFENEVEYHAMYFIGPGGTISFNRSGRLYSYCMQTNLEITVYFERGEAITLPVHGGAVYTEFSRDSFIRTTFISGRVDMFSEFRSVSSFEFFFNDFIDIDLLFGDDAFRLNRLSGEAQPQPPAAALTVKAVSAGGNRTMVLLSDGSLWAFGRGALGDGEAFSNTGRPQPVHVMDNVRAVSSGPLNTMVITQDSTLWGIGMNVGDGSQNMRLSPVRIMDNVAEVSTNGHTLVVTTSGVLYAWGQNTYGQLGDGTQQQRLSPVRIKEGVASVSAGAHHSLAITRDGALYACA